jgi:hypothetical protein
MKWSRTFISTIASASFNSRVRSSSALLGCATPEGKLVHPDNAVLGIELDTDKDFVLQACEL